MSSYCLVQQAGGGAIISPGMGGRGGGRGRLPGGRGGMMPGRGAMGGGRRGPGGMGMGMPMGAAAMGGREYTDLDAPENQRSVLDYGDL